ncbi:uncharacterized protein LOC113226409 isoform X2 [Hyposmocoma kahamanoa]|uniref:uncharacterized protein LOC113226409 isoform X2 n=1 Tax=Hyposmocoma kahamanoa TaxID=1477025 RepID=UPI000E6D963B|nr:uncharacterized protein LOC113226409 isoform X2 [Hyposmocoma kahamanoa]
MHVDSSIFIIVGAVIGLIVIFLLIVGGICIRNRFKKARTNNQPPREEPEYATIPDVVQYAKLDLPRNINRELPKIPTETPYTTIVGKLVPKTDKNVSNTSNN